MMRNNKTKITLSIKLKLYPRKGKEQNGYLYRVMTYLSSLGGSSTRQVDSKYTSLTCPICGYVDKKNRKSEDLFVCQKCGYIDHADVVGALNIAKRIGERENLPVLGREKAEGSIVLPHQFSSLN